MNNTSLHWTEDPDLLEQFILGQLPEERLSVLDEHLRACPQCRQAVERERNFVRSVRAYGRDQLKARLKENLERTPERIVPWPHILSAAAIVVVIVGLGIYNNWWREPAIVQSEEQLAGEKQAEAPPSPAGERPMKVEERGTRALGPSSTEKPLPQKPKIEIQIDDAVKDQQEALAAQAEQPPQVDDSTRRAGAVEGFRAGAGIQNEYWVDGTLVEVIPSEKSGHVPPREAEAADVMAKRAEPQTLIAAQQGRYLLQQLPEKSLPMQQKQIRKGAAVIPTKVEPTPDGALLTAFTDQFNLRNKIVRGESVGADSLVFVVDGVRVVYKLSSIPTRE